MQARARQIASNWMAFVIAILLLVAIVAGSIQLMRRANITVPQVTIGVRDKVYYSHAATLDDATTLGHALQSTGFFNDSGASVLLSKNRGATVVSFVVNEGAWLRPGTVAGFEEIGRRIATSVGGFPIRVDLVDSAWAIQKSLLVGKLVVGARDTIYYLGSATEADAQALAQALRSAGYLEDRGASVVVSKGDTTAIGFVLGEGLWDRPDVVAGFEQLTRRVSTSIGGLPIQMRLLNPQMESKKEAAVR